MGDHLDDNRSTQHATGTGLVSRASGHGRELTIWLFGNLQPKPSNRTAKNGLRYSRAVIKSRALIFLSLLLSCLLSAADIVTFPSGDLTLHGVLYKPEGKGPFPAVVYNHGSAAGMLSKDAFDALGPVFASHGWVFFGPYRRGQGLSASAGPYIGDQISAADKAGGISAAAAAMVRLLETDHLNDQLSASAWLRKQPFVDSRRIAVAGNSFGGIEAVLGAEKGNYCAAIASAAGAQSWAKAPALQSMMTRAVRNATAPIFFFQAANDYDLSPSNTLSAAMKEAAKPYQLKIYPPYGDSPSDGHTFGYFGAAVWAEDVFRFLNQNCDHAK